MEGAIFDESFKRGMVAFVIVFVAALASSLLVVDLSVREVIGMSLAPAVGALATRAGYEGLIDSHRARTGRMSPSDVPIVSDAVDVVEKP